MKPPMKRIRLTVILTLLMLCSLDTPTLTSAGDPPVRRVGFQEPFIQAPKDTLCLRCFEDSIEFIFKSVKKNMARIDSLYANVERNTKKIAENNRNIGVILQECSTPDTAHVAKDGVKAKEAPKDTTTHTIHVRKMK